MEAVTQLSYSVDTLYFLVCGALVMFMAPGFAMLESGLVRAKNTSEILTKNVALFSIASLMYLICGYSIMYSDGSGWIPGFGTALFMTDNSVEDVLASNGDIYYSGASDFFFQVVFVATAMSIISGAVAERMKLFAFLAFAVVMTGFIYPVQGFWKWGGGALDEAGFLAANVSARSVMDVDVKVDAGAARVLAEVSRGVRLIARLLEVETLVDVLAADVDVARARAHGGSRDEATFQEFVRVVPHDLAIFARAWLGLVGVDDQVRGTAVADLFIGEIKGDGVG